MHPSRPDHLPRNSATQPRSKAQERVFHSWEMRNNPHAASVQQPCRKGQSGWHFTFQFMPGAPVPVLIGACLAMSGSCPKRLYVRTAACCTMGSEQSFAADLMKVRCRPDNVGSLNNSTQPQRNTLTLGALQCFRIISGIDVDPVMPNHRYKFEGNLHSHIFQQGRYGNK